MQDSQQLHEDIRRYLTSGVSAWDIANELLPNGEPDRIFQAMREEYENKGQHTYFGDNGRHGFWDGQLIQEMFALFATMYSAKILHSISAAIPIICPLYCQALKSGDRAKKRFNLAVAIADALISAKAQLPLPLAQIAVYLAGSEFLDRCCKCAEAPTALPSEYS